MALALGTNCGFVAAAPVADPDESAYQNWGDAYACKDTSSAAADTITEMGWYCSVSNSDQNFELGVYDDDSNEPDTLLHADQTNATGGTTGWKVVTGLNWSISSSTVYWLAMQVDGDHSIDRVTSGGSGYNMDYTEATLPPSGTWGTSGSDADGMFATYAVYDEGEPPEGTNMEINIGDVWKDVDKIEINIADAWKDVNKVELNVGDVWKEIYST